MKKILITLFVGLSFSISALAQEEIADKNSADKNTIAYKDGKTQLEGYGLKPVKDGKIKSGLLILPAWKGVDLHSKAVAEKLAGFGYYTFVADIYGKDERPSSTAEAGTKSGYYKKNYTEYQKRIKLALEQLIKLGADPNYIVVVGYCFGGTGALEAARGELAVKGVVSFHGGLSKDNARENKPLAAKILVLHGAEDPFVPAEEVASFQKEMRESKADWQMIYYANAVHAFSDSYAGSDASTGAAFNEVAAKRSWNHMLVFLRDILK